MYEMIERGLRGGMCQVSHKHVQANNKYRKSYNQYIISSYINYLYDNNLYGKGMSKPLPYEGFEWSNDINNTEDVLHYSCRKYCYFLEVDLEYPTELHDLHSDYPLAPESVCVTSDMVSDFSKSIYKKKHTGKCVNDEKTQKLILMLRIKQTM